MDLAASSFISRGKSVYHQNWARSIWGPTEHVRWLWKAGQLGPRLSEFEFDIVHRTGTKHQAADELLSWLITGSDWTKLNHEVLLLHINREAFQTVHNVKFEQDKKRLSTTVLHIDAFPVFAIRLRTSRHNRGVKIQHSGPATVYQGRKSRQRVPHVRSNSRTAKKIVLIWCK